MAFCCAVAFESQLWSQLWVVLLRVAAWPRRCCGVQRLWCTHAQGRSSCKNDSVHATRRMPWALHRAVRVGSRRAGRAVRRAACPPLVSCGDGLLEAHAGMGMGTRGVLEGRPSSSVAACRRPSRSSPCSARHPACRACTRTAPPEYLIAPRRASESRARTLPGFFCGFSARPNTSGR
jgi:hypothetical protein